MFSTRIKFPLKLVSFKPESELIIEMNLSLCVNMNMTFKGSVLRINAFINRQSWCFRDLGFLLVLCSGLYRLRSLNRLMIVNSIVNSIIFSGGGICSKKKKTKKKHNLTDPSFIGPECAHCDV